MLPTAEVQNEPQGDTCSTELITPSTGSSPRNSGLSQGENADPLKRLLRNNRYATSVRLRNACAYPVHYPLHFRCMHGCMRLNWPFTQTSHLHTCVGCGLAGSGQRRAYKRSPATSTSYAINRTPSTYGLDVPTAGKHRFRLGTARMFRACSETRPISLSTLGTDLVPLCPPSMPAVCP